MGICEWSGSIRKVKGNKIVQDLPAILEIVHGEVLRDLLQKMIHMTCMINDDPDEFADEWGEEFGDGSYEDGYDDAYDYWEDEMD